MPREETQQHRLIEEETPLLPRVSTCNLLLSAEQEESRERLSQNAESVSGLEFKKKLAFSLFKMYQLT